MSEKCRWLGYITIVLGVMGSIFLAYQFGNVVDFEYASHVYYARNWGLTCLYFCTGCFSSVLLGTIFIGMAEIMDSISDIKDQQQKLFVMLNKKINNE